MVSNEDAESRGPTSGSSNISGDHRQYHHSDSLITSVFFYGSDSWSINQTIFAY